MTPLQRVKKRPAVQLVGVITTRAELRRAIGMKGRPDLFEIRLDYFDPVDARLKADLARLNRPVIITCRRAAEGGAAKLSDRKRAERIGALLEQADYVDVELRSAEADEFRALLRSARSNRIGCIISFHDFNSTPSVRSLRTKAQQARRVGATVFKVATRTDSPTELGRLLEFMGNPAGDLPVAAMGTGRLALKSRLLLTAAGSTFAYGSIGRPRFAGQPSLAQLRSALAGARKRLS